MRESCVSEPSGERKETCAEAGQRRRGSGPRALVTTPTNYVCPGSRQFQRLTSLRSVSSFSARDKVERETGSKTEALEGKEEDRKAYRAQHYITVFMQCVNSKGPCTSKIGGLCYMCVYIYHIAEGLKY